MTLIKGPGKDTHPYKGALYRYAPLSSGLVKICTFINGPGIDMHPYVGTCFYASLSKSPV